MLPRLQIRPAGLASFQRIAPRKAPRLSRLQIRPAAALLATTTLIAGCGTAGGGAGTAGSSRLTVVAAENFWGSIAAQLGGDRVTVTSLITNPSTDPHTYEPTPQDGRTIAQASYLIINGAGYDPWAPKLADANPSPGRGTLTVADLAGRKAGDNPHMWYSPTIVEQAVERITSDYRRLDPADSGFFSQQASSFTSSGLKRYTDLLRSIRGRFSGVSVGATESIFVDLAGALGLDLVSPPEYMRAISEGNDPTAGDKITFDAQISGRRIAVLVVNSQNSTPDIQALAGRATANRIPIVRITETLDPPTAAFQEWQAAQLEALQSALATATGR